MYKLIFLCTLLALTSALKIHDYHHEEGDHGEYKEETEHHHEVEHKHATSHQSVKLHHHHAVPVYIKKEDQHLLKNPIQIGGTKQKLKILHPETEHHHNHGLVLENHSESHHEHHGHYDHEPHYEHYHHE